MTTWRARACRPTRGDQHALNLHARAVLRRLGVAQRRHAGHLPTPEPCIQCGELVRYFASRRRCVACQTWPRRHQGEPRPPVGTIRYGRPPRPVGPCQTCGTVFPLTTGGVCLACYDRARYWRKQAQAGRKEVPMRDDLAARCGDCGAPATITDSASPGFALCDACAEAIRADAEAWERMRQEEGHPPCKFLAEWLPRMIAQAEQRHEP